MKIRRGSSEKMNYTFLQYICINKNILATITLSHVLKGGQLFFPILSIENKSLSNYEHLNNISTDPSFIKKLVMKSIKYLFFFFVLLNSQSGLTQHEHLRVGGYYKYERIFRGIASSFEVFLSKFKSASTSIQH